MTIRQLGKMLKALREHKGLTQTELAKRAKVNQSYIAMLERGDRKNPSLEKLRQLAKVLKVKVQDLLA